MSLFFSFCVLYILLFFFSQPIFGHDSKNFWLRLVTKVSITRRKVGEKEPMLQQSMTSSTRHVILYKEYSLLLLFFSLKRHIDTKCNFFCSLLSWKKKDVVSFSLMSYIKNPSLCSLIYPFTTRYSHYSQPAAAESVSHSPAKASAAPTPPAPPSPHYYP